MTSMRSQRSVELALYERALRAEDEVKRLREQAAMWQGIAVRWACCKAGLDAAPDLCPWHGDGVRFNEFAPKQQEDRDA